MLRNREKFACEAAFFFLFRRAVFRKSCLLETFHIWIGKNCDWLQLLIVYRISIGSMPFWVLRLNIRCSAFGIGTILAPILQFVDVAL